MVQPAINRPLPTPRPETDFYWERAQAHELWLMHCDDCQRAYFYPRPICPQCFSRGTRWVQSTGRGTVHAFAIVHRPPTPAFQSRVPYVAALVELEEGVRVPTLLVGVEADPEKVRIGMAVEVLFEDVTDGVTLPLFRPASQ